MNELALSTSPTPTLALRRWSRPDGPARAYPENAHPTWEVARVTRGLARYDAGRAHFDVGPGATILVPAEVGHVTTFEGAAVATSLQISAARFEGIARAAHLDPSGDPMVFAPSDARAERLDRLFQLISDEVARADAGSALAIDALGEALVVEALRGSERATERLDLDPRIARAIELVQSCFADPLSVDDLARAAAMSRFHFSRCFRAQVGLSPYQYVQKIRVERAALMLSRGRTVSQAALDVGFSDLSRFARAFRRHLGCTPNEWASREDRRCA